MRVRLTLKQPYTWPSRNPNKPNQNDYGFVETKQDLQLNQKIVFAELGATSNAGDLNPNHYKYFLGKNYLVTMDPNGFYNLIEQ